VHQQVLLLAEPVNQEKLSLAAESLTTMCRDLDHESIAKLLGPFDPLEQEVLTLIQDEMARFSKVLGGEIYRDGLTHMLAEPEFSESTAARRALRILEERSLLENLLSRTILTTRVGGVEVLIGGEGNWEELSECAIVLARYGAPDMITGTLGVIGPIRMPYGHTIPTVRFVAGVLSDLVTEMFVE